jgi:putative colanic acid biosynthesis acetyltransferase WcaF
MIGEKRAPHREIQAGPSEGICAPGLAAEVAVAAVVADAASPVGSPEPVGRHDPYLRPSTTLRNRLARVAWNLVWTLLFRPSPRPLHAWRRVLLRCFGARIGRYCHIYPKARIWAPWNLECEDYAAIANDAEVYNPATVRLGSHACISQGAYLCGATHDFDDPAFPMIWAPITIGDYAWVAARATVLMGVTVGEGAVLGLGAVATRDLQPWMVHAGNPARPIRRRRARPGGAA